MEKIIERVKKIILSPKDALNEVKTEEMTVVGTMKEYVAILAAIPAVAHFVGRALVGHPVFGRENIFRMLIFAAISYVFTLLGVIVFGKIINALAPNFNSNKNDLNAFKLAIYSWTPAFVAGIFNIIPGMQVLSLLGAFYGLYILYIGLPILMETPQEKTLVYTVANVIVSIIVWIIIGAIASALALGGAGSLFYL